MEINYDMFKLHKKDKEKKIIKLEIDNESDCNFNSYITKKKSRKKKKHFERESAHDSSLESLFDRESAHDSSLITLKSDSFHIFDMEVNNDMLISSKKDNEKKTIKLEIDNESDDSFNSSIIKKKSRKQIKQDKRKNNLDSNLVSLSESDIIISPKIELGSEIKRKKRKRKHMNLHLDSKDDSSNWQVDSIKDERPEDHSDSEKVNRTVSIEISNENNSFSSDTIKKKSRKQIKQFEKKNDLDSSFPSHSESDIIFPISPDFEVKRRKKKKKKRKHMNLHLNSEDDSLNMQVSSFEDGRSEDHSDSAPVHRSPSIKISNESGNSLNSDTTKKNSKKQIKLFERKNDLDSSFTESDIMSPKSELDFEVQRRKKKKRKHMNLHLGSENDSLNRQVSSFEDGRPDHSGSVNGNGVVGIDVLDNEIEFTRDKSSFKIKYDSSNSEDIDDPNIVSILPQDNLPFINVDEISVDKLDDIIHTTETSISMSPKMIERLSSLEIPLTFDVPETHMIETRISHEINQDQRESFDQLGVTMKKGKFNPDEDAIIRKNWEKFSKEFGFDDPKPFLIMSVHGKTYIKASERRHFVQYLARGLPNRYLNAVYRRFKILYGPQSSDSGSRYQENFDEVILECKRKGIKDPFSKLALVMGKNRQCIYKRYCVLQSNKNLDGRKRVKWSLEIAQQIVQSLMKVCKVSDIEELREEAIPWSTWLLVADECGYRPESIKQFWDKKLSTQIFATKPIFEKQLILDLTRRLLDLNVKHWQDINWQELSKDFNGARPLFLFRRLSRLKERIPKETWSSLRDYLLFVQNKFSKFSVRDAVLQRYSVSEDGTLIPIVDRAESDIDEIND